MESQERTTERTEKRTKTNKWFVIWFVTLVLVFGMMSMSFYMLRDFWHREQDKHQEEIKLAIAKQRNVFKQEAEALTKERLRDAILHLQPKLDKVLAERIAEHILIECQNKCLDPALIVGLINVESEFNPFAESKKGAIGLMQIRYSTWKEEPELHDNGVKQKGALFWIDRNVKSGTTILKKYYDESNCDMVRALYRYNTGSPNLPKDTGRWDLRYVNKVIYHTYMVKMFLTDDNRCNQEAETEDKEGG